MKKKIKTFRNKSVFFLIMIFFMGIPGFVWAQNTEEMILKAYELRMNGRADSSETVLKNILMNDSLNALAYFELARTTQHLGLANPRKMFEQMDVMQSYIEKAVKLEAENIDYLVYKGQIEILKLYAALMMGEKNVKDQLNQIENTFLTALRINPEFYEVKLTLVELFGVLDEKMGGDKEKAEKYATELENDDVFFGAKAREILLEQNVDRIEFWEGIRKKLPDNPCVLEELGKSYLVNNKVDEAKEFFQKVTKANPGKCNLYLTTGRFYLLQAMQNREALDSIAPLIEKEFMAFLDKNNSKLNRSIQAWVFGQLAQIKFRTGDKENGQKLIDKANMLDPFFSKAFAVPGQFLFCPPKKIEWEYAYYFRPI